MAKETPIKNLDSSRDAILVVEDASNTRKFLVSTNILRLASPIFAALFSRKFSKGIKVLQGGCPEIELKEGNPAVMQIILAALHYKEPKKVDSSMLAKTAFTVTNIIAPIHLGHGPECGTVMFSAISLEVQKHFNPDKICLDWTTNEDLSQLLPSNIMNDLIDVTKKSQTHLHNEVQSVEGHLRFP